jgi:hypothetical protein
MMNSIPSQVKNGFRLAGWVLLGIAWLGLVFAGLGIAFTPGPRSPLLGWGILAISGLVLIFTMDKWVRLLPGLLAYGACSGIFILADGHALNHPEVPVPRFEAVILILFFVTAAAVSFSFSKHKLSAIDRIALFIFVACFFGQAVAPPRWMWLIVGIGLACLFGAWLYGRTITTRVQHLPKAKNAG